MKIWKAKYRNITVTAKGKNILEGLANCADKINEEIIRGSYPRKISSENIEEIKEV